MPPSFNQWRDKSRQLLHQLSLGLGEKVSAKPASLQEKAKAEEVLSLELPAFTSLLPYETMGDDLLFINACSVGFGLHLLPSSGVDESLMQTLSTLFKNKLPAGVDCTVLLYKHHYLASQLAASFLPILEQGGIGAELASLSLDYHVKAIKQGYKNGRNVPAQLADYRCYLFLSTPKSSNSQIRLQHCREEWESELKVAGFAHARMDSYDFQILLRALVSPNLNATSWSAINDRKEKEADAFIRDYIPHPSSVYSIQDNGIDVSSLDEEGIAHRTRLINCEVVEWPKPNNPFALWRTPDLFANLLKPEQGIQCPFCLSMTIRGVDQEKVKTNAKKRAKSTNANNNAIQNFLNPGLNEEAQEWQLVHEEVTQGDLALYPVFYNLILYTTEDKAREHVAKAISSYRQLGFTLMPSRCKQFLRFLASLPFLLTERLFTPLNLMGMMKPLSHYNVANLLPVIADFKGSQQGLLIPTYRHQLFFYDPFDDKNLPITNYNRLTVASTGAGKSYLQQALLLDGLSRGHQIFVIDLGASYKHLCQLVGGSYIDATTITLNPFTLFDFDGV
uniref:TraC family protein n=1 Tax=Legionella sp. TaxID=459 RepID=UPI00321FA79B